MSASQQIDERRRSWLRRAAAFVSGAMMVRQSPMILGASILLGAGLVAFNVYPGAAAHLALFVAILSAPFVAALMLGSFAYRFWIWRDLHRAIESLRRLVLPASVLAVCAILAVSGLPRRVAFWASLRSFRSARESLQRSGDTGGRLKLNRRIGAWKVDRYAIDPRGGVFFRTGAGFTLGPDGMHYGFAYRPNPEGSPFGRAGYRLSRMSAHWYSFSVSDDYY
jgi:hypothetical protein